MIPCADRPPAPTSRSLQFGLATVAVLLLVLGVGPAVAQSKKAGEWTTRCDEGGAKECFELARAHLRGKEQLARDANEAARFYGRACELGLAEACQEYGEALLIAAEGIALDTAHAMAVLGRACELEPQGKSGKALGLVGGRNRCQGVTELYRQRPPENREDSVAAKRVANAACTEARIETACVLLDAGWRAFPDSVALPDSVKRALVAEAARLDSIRVADSLQRVKDSVAAAEKARREEAARARAAAPTQARPSRRDVLRRGTLKGGCDAGDAVSCATLADWLREGRGGPPDPEQAAAARKRACELDRKYCSS